MKGPSFFVKEFVGHGSELLSRSFDRLVGELTTNFDRESLQDLFLHEIVDRHFADLIQDVREVGCWASTIPWKSSKERLRFLLSRSAIEVTKVSQKPIPIRVRSITVQEIIYFWIGVHIEFGFELGEFVLGRRYICSCVGRLNTPNPNLYV